MERETQFLTSALIALKHSEGWEQLEKIIDKEVSHLYKQIMKATTFEEVLEARAQIKCYQKIKGEVEWAVSFNEDKRKPING